MTDDMSANPSNVNLVPAPPTVRTPKWDGRLSTYAAIRGMVPAGPHGRPGFVASMLTASRPGPAALWDGRAWASVPLGWTVVVRGAQVWAERPPADQTTEPADPLPDRPDGASAVAGQDGRRER